MSIEGLNGQNKRTMEKKISLLSQSGKYQTTITLTGAQERRSHPDRAIVMEHCNQARKGLGKKHHPLLFDFVT
jgi:hypothetical protein